MISAIKKQKTLFPWAAWPFQPHGACCVHDSLTNPPRWHGGGVTLWTVLGCLLRTNFSLEKFLWEIASLQNPIWFFPDDFLGQGLVSDISDGLLPAFAWRVVLQLECQSKSFSFPNVPLKCHLFWKTFRFILCFVHILSHSLSTWCVPSRCLINSHEVDVNIWLRRLLILCYHGLDSSCKQGKISLKVTLGSSPTVALRIWLQHLRFL